MLTDKDNLPTSDSLNKIYESLSLVSNDINTSNIIQLTINLMRIIEKYPNLTGTQKKETIIYVLKKVIKDNLDNDETKQNLLFFIDTFLPYVIDTIISVDKKEVVIKIKKGFKKCFTC